MTDIGSVPNRPAGTDARSIAAIIANFDFITAFIDGNGWVSLDKLGSDVTPSLLPSGVILAYGGAAAPTGFLMCDGASYLRNDYTNLFNALGGASSPFGLPDGTHFNVPDLRGRVPVGQDNMGTAAGEATRLNEPDDLGETGGNASHTLTASELPSHTHEASNESPAHLLADSGGVHWAYAGDNTISGATDIRIVDPTTDNGTGGGQPHNNLQPYQITNYIVKT